MALEQGKDAAGRALQDRVPDDRAREMLQQIPGWEMVDNTIQRTFSVSNFVAAMDFANQITPIAEQENHHPDLHISYGKVRVELSTHKVGGLSQKDFTLAAMTNQLWDNKQEAASI